MSKLEKLINELCPNGVEYKKIGDVCDILRGKRLTKKELSDEGKYPVLHGGSSPMGYYNVYNRKANTTVVVNTGNAGSVFFYDKEFWSSDACFSIYPKDCLRDKFIFFFLSSNEHKLKSRIRYGAMPTIDSLAVETIKIPVPPIEVQDEIVKILDNFAKLTAELTAELTARQKQYSFYRDYLLDFTDEDITKKILDIDCSNVEYKKLGDIASVTKLAGFEFTKYVSYSENGNIIALRGLNVKNGKLVLDDVKYIDKSDLSKLSRSKLEIGDMLFTYVGTVGQVALINENDKFYLAPNVAMIRLDNKKMILPKYLMYYFQTNTFWNNQINKLLQSSSMKNIPMEKIRKFVIPVPPISVQENIVKILDRFDKLNNDMSEGLPAEIEARRKQYEYYRDKLLTFKKKEIAENE